MCCVLLAKVMTTLTRNNNNNIVIMTQVIITDLTLAKFYFSRLKMEFYDFMIAGSSGCMYLWLCGNYM